MARSISQFGQSESGQSISRTFHNRDFGYRHCFQLSSDFIWKIRPRSKKEGTAKSGKLGEVLKAKKPSGLKAPNALFSQIISQLHALIIFGYWSFLPVLFWRIVFGPIGSSSLLSMSLFNLNVFSYCTLFGISECYIYKFITILVIKRMAPIIDDFFARFLFLWKVIAASLANVVHIHTIAHAQSMTSFLGMPNDTLLYNPLLKIQ